MTGLSISCLGSFHVLLWEEDLSSQFDTDKTRALLSYLAVEASRSHRREHLAGLLWSDLPGQKALHNLRQTLSCLRKVLREDQLPLGSPALLVSRETVQLNPAAEVWVDVNEFQNSLSVALGCTDQGKPCSPDGKLPVRDMQRALAIYQGRFLDQFYLDDSNLFEEWAALQREELNCRAIEGLSLLSEYYERRGEYTLARRTVQRMVDLAPWQESGQAELMRLLAVEGQWAAAQTRYQILRRNLAEEMGVAPSPFTTLLYESIGQAAVQNIPLPARFPLACHNLPLVPFPLVGRQRELDDLARLLPASSCRLLTLLGPGGIGKTRLALEIAREQVGLFADGVFFVPLAAITTAELIVPALAEAIGFQFYVPDKPMDLLLSYLRGKDMLLVLDSMEHLLGSQSAGGSAAGLIIQLLEKAPGVKLLVTSRAPLNLRMEQVVELGGLDYPSSKDPFQGQNDSALILFEQAAQRIQSQYSLAAERDAVTRICQLLEGNPLAIELSATWVRVQSCETIATQISRDMGFLTTTMQDIPERHRSMRAVFEHAWALLSEAERLALQALSVFRGGFTEQAAGQVAGAGPVVLKSLVEQSLVRQDGPNRLDLSPLVRQFVTEKLDKDPGAQKIAAVKHAVWYAGRLGAFAQRVKSSGQVQALMELTPENENIRLAWKTLVEQTAEEHLVRSVDGLYHYYDFRSRFQEGIELLALAGSVLEPASLILAMVLARKGALCLRIADYDCAAESLSRSQMILESMPHPSEMAFCLELRSNLAEHLGNYESAMAAAKDSLKIYRDLEDLYGESQALLQAGKVSYRMGQIEEAREFLETSLEAGRQTGAPRQLVGPLNFLADVYCHLGVYSSARSLFEESLEICHRIGDPYHTALVLNNIGTIDQTLKQYASAENCYQQSCGICQEIGDRIGEAIALSNLGEVACELSEYGRAEGYARRALAIGRGLQDPWTILAVLNTLGEIALEVGNYPAAWRALAEALQVSVDTRTLQMLARSLVDSGGVLLKEGNTPLALKVFSTVLYHPACQDDYRQRGQKMLAAAGLGLPEATPGSLENLAAEILTLLNTAGSARSQL